MSPLDEVVDLAYGGLCQTGYLNCISPYPSIIGNWRPAGLAKKDSDIYNEPEVWHDASSRGIAYSTMLNINRLLNNEATVISGYMVQFSSYQRCSVEEVAEHAHSFSFSFFNRLIETVNDSLLTPAAAQIIANLGQKSGLQDIADKLGIKRVGMAHQAGSDSLVTGEIYWKMHQVVFNGTIDKAKYSGQVWGLNGQLSAVTYYNNNQAQQTPNLNGATIYSNVERSRKSDTSATRQCRNLRD
ncbi:CCR4-NOT transcription complex subunit 7 [Rasamsonia emersonii CBS 393.64]|uniref:CCR4-NOT transcription complex subunit 7 n=1 Tax=Rasamsonia emersonii (strain ATCC 16479 / CBS 393.64 / IMI 116815) TaxID=1408163 RepID=A0A0F4Z1H5_RASE3|nr:CCR4-NOT transcription complex subunit 7 [Rasamsonia emersonii CBS 393.64]KKA24359.1 CCR4-NOT transcription complex subunit 7 [Rasamsonia emersonii CBS 393.64]